MLCQNCNQREANVHITKIVNGVKQEMHLCEECAKQKNEFNMINPFNLATPMSFQNILEGFFEMMGGVPQQIPEPVTCPVCHQSFDEFKRTGKMGCANCYRTFNNEITPIIKRVHGNINHTGKVPKRTGGILKIKRDIEKLKEELKIAIMNEEYEKAAKIRDQIKELESKL
ncbi:UvrB/uvrC motif protein [Caloramator mitchellensis]|uniref:UvrB/uvrC motif protein n=1 Tax=Caloramator mitchellensis TaxID=908809 RepID=A0A0R3JRH4_CALMK|nr:UvrB/UvrC motif-containing protein [Caloramator mitchellensis]KRQ86080.1 UvrB/uvrC motif protein [Caloramator mitchellensis]